MTGDQLKQWRQGKSMTRKQLGDDFGVSEHTVAKWEQGVNPIPKAVQRLVTQPPQFSLTIDEFRRLQDKSKETGRSIEAICLDIIRAGLKIGIAAFLSWYAVS